MIALAQRLALAALMLSCLWRLSAAVPGADFFTNESVFHFEIQLSEESLQALREEPREYVPATVRADGQTYTNVGVHLKGVATFRPVDGQPSLTLNFSKFVADQRFHGLRKIHLNNGKEDPTFLREAISAEMFAEAGVPVARVTLAHARLMKRLRRGNGCLIAFNGDWHNFQPLSIRFRNHLRSSGKV